TYFSNGEDGSQTVYNPGEYLVIEEGGKYGFGHIEYLPVLPDVGEMDAWAHPEVVAAIEENLVPTYLQNLYLNNITREEFCDLVIQAIQEVLGQDIEDVVKAQTGKDLSAWQKEYPFTDSSSSTVEAAYALGIASGRGSGVFDPYATITRQEAAALLMRSAKVLGMDTESPESAGYTDGDQVGVWFKDAVDFVHQINVMGGTGGNSFSPLGTYTREQSFMTIYRLFQAVAGEE
ncbi:MAG: S-layer homology domain-containing protein, partial [Oscillospiraceae bacterium]|nr:S-layer homology domain-containing protein [Oscillospiraceae bacterium]